MNFNKISFFLYSLIMIVCPAMAKETPKIAPEVLETGIKAYKCVKKKGLIKNPNKLTIIDYSKPSSEKRMWVLDVDKKQVASQQLVAHGSKSGGNQTTAFSNANGSHKTSYGVFLTGEPYTGRNGLSLRLDGLEPGLNDKAIQRGIVIHGANYVSENFVKNNGRLGRSWGCPAIEKRFTKETIDQIKSGSVVVAYYPDKNWLKNSELLNC